MKFQIWIQLPRSPIDFLGGSLNISPAMTAKVNQRLVRFLKLRPTNASANYYLAHNILNPGHGNVSKDDLVMGERPLRTTLRLNPNLPNAYFDLGRVLEAKHQLQGAIVVYVHVAKLDPYNARYHYRLSLAYRTAGEHEKAQAEVALFEQLRAAEETSNSAEVAQEAC